jgi:hypothetical protein
MFAVAFSKNSYFKFPILDFYYMEITKIKQEHTEIQSSILWTAWSLELTHWL